MKLGRFFGVDVSVHWSALILVFLVFQGLFRSLGAKFPEYNELVLGGISLLTGVGLLGSILAHEYGHALTGRKFGVSFGSIILHVFGGVAGMTGRIPSAKAEFWMAIAGPIVSFALSIQFFVLAIIVAMFGGGEVSPINMAIVWLSYINFILGAFNLIPAFPLDGGRILRSAVWWRKKNFFSATKVAAKSGKIFGGGLIGCGALMLVGIPIPFFGVGILNGIWIGIIGFLVITMAKQELKAAYRH